MIDEPSSPDSRPLGSIRPMPVYLALGWTMTTLFVQIVLRSALLGAGEVTRADLARLFGCQLAAYLLVLFLILRVHAPTANIRSFLALRGTHPAFYPLGLLLGILAQIPAEALARVVIRRYPLEDETSLLDSLAGDTIGRKVMFGVVIVLLGPLLEEAFYRGALFKPIERAHAAMRSMAILFTGLLFAGAHLSWHSFLPLWMLGLTLGFLRQASGSLLPSLLFHAGFNGVTFYLSLHPSLTEGDPLAPFPKVVLAAGLGGTAVLLALVHLVSRRTTRAALAMELDQQ